MHMYIMYMYIFTGEIALWLPKADCFSKGPGFGSQHPHRSSQPHGTPAPGDLAPSSGLCGYHMMHRHTCRQNTKNIFLSGGRLHALLQYVTKKCTLDSISLTTTHISPFKVSFIFFDISSETRMLLRTDEMLEAFHWHQK